MSDQQARCPEGPSWVGHGAPSLKAPAHGQVSCQSTDGSCLPRHLRHPSRRGQGRKESPLLGGRQPSRGAGGGFRGWILGARWACSPSGWAPPPHLGREGGRRRERPGCACSGTCRHVCAPCPGSQEAQPHTALQGFLGTKRGPAAGGVLWGPVFPPLPAQPPARAGPCTYWSGTCEGRLRFLRQNCRPPSARTQSSMGTRMRAMCSCPGGGSWAERRSWAGRGSWARRGS